MKTDEKTILIEQTSKQLKLHTFLSLLALMVGVVVTVFGAMAENAAPLVITGIALLLGGLAWLAVTKVRVWWNHE